MIHPLRLPKTAGKTIVAASIEWGEHYKFTDTEWMVVVFM